MAKEVTCKICGASFTAGNKALVMHVGSAHADILAEALAQLDRKKTGQERAEPVSELAKSITDMVTTTDHIVHTLLLDITRMRDIIEKLEGKDGKKDA